VLSEKKLKIENAKLKIETRERGARRFQFSIFNFQFAPEVARCARAVFNFQFSIFNFPPQEGSHA
jgi:hypothetical protein